MPIIDVLMKPIWLFPKKLRDHALRAKEVVLTELEIMLEDAMTLSN